MTAQTSASGRAARLRPDDVLRYLAATGWRRGRDYGRGQIWELEPPHPVGAAPPNPQPYEVLVPLDQRLRDYPLRMTDLLETVASAEQRDAESVLGDLDLRWADVLYVRLGEFTLADLAPALTGLRDLALAAARAVDTRHAWDFVRGADVAASRTGVPVLTVRTTLTPDPGEAGEPVERKVTRTMYEGVLGAFRAAIGDNESQAYFPIVNGYRATRPALAREVCAALARIGGRSRSGYELRFTWSPDVPFKGDQAVFEFTPRVLGEVARAARDLRDLG